MRLPDSLALIAGKVADISIGGAAFVRNQPLKTGANCTLIIDLPSQGGSATPTAVAITVLNCMPVPGAPRQHRANLRFGVLPENLRNVLDAQLRKLG